MAGENMTRAMRIYTTIMTRYVAEKPRQLKPMRHGDGLRGPFAGLTGVEVHHTTAERGVDGYALRHKVMRARHRDAVQVALAHASDLDDLLSQ